MEEKKKKTTIEAMILLAVLAAALIGLFFLTEYIKDEQKVQPPREEITVSLKIKKAEDWIVEYMDVKTKNNTVFKLLLECKEFYNLSVDYINWQGYDSIFVNSINGTQNGEDDMWWQYYVNDVYGEIAADKKEIFDGDYVEWRFEKP